MKTKAITIGVALALAAVSPARGFLDEEANDVRVDVVIDVTDAGKKIVRPTPDKPAYYLPLSVGYLEMGAYVPNQQPPPPKAGVEDVLNQMLDAQGYRVMTKQSPPTLVLVFWWGHLAPEVNSTEMNAPAAETNSFNAGMVDPNVAAFDSMDPRTLVASLPTGQTANESQMVSLVAGNTRDYQYATNEPNPILQQILAMERSPRDYMMISAFDFHDWLHHQATLLWRAHISTELWGHNLKDVIEPMIAAAGPLLGRETIAPRLIGAKVTHVIIGQAVVTGFPALKVPGSNENRPRDLNLVNQILPDSLP